MTRFTLSELHFIGARVTAYVRAHPSTLPLLGEPAPRPKVETCERGHSDWTTQHGGKQRCRACARAKQRERRARG